MNQNDLAYFEFMNESLSAYEEISNELLSTRYMVNSVKEMGETPETILESVKETISQFVKKIFKAIKDFFKKCINFITGKTKAENKAFLIKACEDRLKSISAEDKRSFKIKNANILKASKIKIDNIKNKVDEVMEIIPDLTKQIKDEDSTVVMFSDSSEKMMKLDRLKEEIRKESKASYNKKDLPDVIGDDIPDILYAYKNSDSEVKGLKDELKQKEKVVEEIEKMLSGYISRASISEDRATYIRNAIVGYSNLITEVINAQINITLYNVKYLEGILRTFSKYKLNEYAYDDVENLDPYLESVMDDYYRSCITNASDIDPGSDEDEDDNDIIDSM